jgi:type II secretory pathway component PulK
MKSRQSSRRAAIAARRGVVLIAVIVGLAIAAAIWFAVIKTAVTERTVVRNQQWALQARELAMCGIERAAAQLAADSDYAGETWHVPAASLDDRHAAEVVIEVVSDEAQPRRRSVRIEAHYPESEIHRASETLKTSIDLSSQRNGS